LGYVEQGLTFWPTPISLIPLSFKNARGPPQKMVIAAAMVLTASALIKLMYSRVLLTCKVGRTAWEGGKGWKCFGEASRLEAGGKVTPNPWEEGISLGLQAPTGFRACDGGNVCANCRPKGINLEIRRPGQD
jgi:hypothetical protein